MKELSVKADHAGLRADAFLAECFPEFSRSALKNLIVKGKLQLNGQPVEPSYKLSEGQVLNFNLASLKPPLAELALPIIYEDDQVVVINKPRGVLSHGVGGIEDEPSVASFVRSRLNGFTGDVGQRAGLVHRLDRATSGVIVTAKNPQAMAFLQNQFASRQAKKTYVALVEGTPEPAKALIDRPIARDRHKPKLFVVSAEGKPAQTEYKCLRTVNNQTLVELKPLTGRTHQIRVHLKSIGHPVAGDELYSDSVGPLKLHAWKLKLNLPDGKLKEFVAEPPADLL